MGAPVTHFEVNVRDPRRAQEFYSNLFAWKIDATNPAQYGLINTGVKMGINGGIGQTEDDMPPFVTFYVQVEEPQSYLDKAVSLGGRVITPVTEIPNMVTFDLFSDPEGNLVGIVKGPQSTSKGKEARTRKRKAARGKRRGRR